MLLKFKIWLRFFFLLKNIRFKYLNCKPYDYVIFDEISLLWSSKFMPTNDFFVLESRYRIVYFNFLIIIKFFFHFFKSFSLTTSYFSAVLDYVSPHSVLTYIDNNPNFFKLSAYYNKARFVAVQNASRFEIRFEQKAHNIFLDHFFCFGQFEIDLYHSKEARVNNYYPIGSLRNHLYRTSSFRPSRKAYDICVVCEPSPGWDDIEGLGFEDSLGSIAKFALKYALSNGKTICFAGKRSPNSMERIAELNWYQKYIGDEAKNIKENIKEHFSTYQLIDSSDVSIGFISTALLEGMSRGNRCLQCNYTGNVKWDFHYSGPWFTSEYTYEDFAKCVDYLFSLNDSEFNALSKKCINYFIEDLPSDVAIKKVKEFVLNV